MVMYGTDDKVWIQCECGQWFHISRMKINEKSIPDVLTVTDNLVLLYFVPFHNTLLCTIIPSVTTSYIIY